MVNSELLDRVHLVCPACRQPGAEPGVIEIGEIYEQEGPFAIRGLLKCTRQDCRAVYPIVDGVPILVRDPVGWWESQGAAVQAGVYPDDGLGDLFFALDRTADSRKEDLQSVNCYLDVHHCRPDLSTPPDGLAELWDNYWQAVTALIVPDADPEGKSLDLGCSTGRFTFDMAETSQMAVGIDIRFDAVRHAVQLQRKGQTAFQRDTGGRRFESVEIQREPADNVIFMVADALDPPFGPYAFDRVAALNLLDNVAVPTILLGQMDALLKKGGQMILASPYEWRPELTAPDQWLVDREMPSAEAVRAILKDCWGPGLGLNYEIVDEIDPLPWVLRRNDRHWTVFLAHLVRAVKREMAGGS